jgi:hypothetical protein
MELSSSKEPAVSQLLKNSPSILWNLKVDYYVNKSPQLVPNLNQINPPYTTPHCFSTINLNIILPLMSRSS